MNAKRVKTVLSVVFFAAGVLVILYMIRYIAVTQPRDSAQEQCNTQTITVLTQWLQIRKQRDTAMDIRDEAAITALDHQLSSGAATPEELKAWRDAVVADRHVRATADASSPPLPQC